MEISTAQLQAWIQACATRIGAEREYLTQLDAAIGDADHGTNLARGFAVAAGKLEDLTGEIPAHVFKSVAMTLMSAVGGASGMLYGNFFLRAAAAAGDRQRLEAEEFARVLRAGLDGIVQRGRAQSGDKTMIDAWLPALAALEDALASGTRLIPAVEAAAAAAMAGAQGTRALQARKGRASYLGPRSVDHEDPGAVSTALIWQALAETLAAPAMPSS